jgi:small subunit ribosomal protein S17e
MGRIKSTLVKRTAKNLLEKIPECFGLAFTQNKKSLGATMPSKRIRNRIAGYLSRLNKNSKKIIIEKPKDE